MKSCLSYHGKSLCVILSLLLTASCSLYAAHNKPAVQDDINIDEFDFDFGPDDVIVDEPRTPSLSKEPGFDFNLPFVGTKRLVPFVDEQTNQSGLKISISDKTNRPSLGALIIEDAEIKFVNGALSIEGHVSLLGKRGTFSASQIIFSDEEETLPDGQTKSKNVINKLILTCTFVDQPTITLSPTKTITLDAIDIILQRGKPLILQSKTTIFGTRLIMGFAFTKKTISAFANIPPDTRLTRLVPDLATTPLNNAILKEAKLTIHNIYVSENSKSSTKTAENKEDKQLTISVTGTIACNSGQLMGEQSPNQQPDTTASLTITIAKNGIQGAGDIQKDITYADITLHNGHFAFDTDKKTFSITGTATLQGMLFNVEVSMDRNPKDPDKTTAIFHAYAESPEFIPFKTTPGLETLKVTDLTAHIKLKKIGDQMQKELIFDGNITIFGMALSSIIKFVENENKEKGIYIEMPLTENKSLGQIIPGFNKSPFTEIKFTAASFQACSINYTEPETGTKINKGLSLLAHVPLTGPLAKAAAITGSKNQDFILKGALALNNPQGSEFSILLSRGDPDTNQKFSLGEIVLALSGKPSVKLGAEVIYRPANNPPLEFRGTFDFDTDVTKPTPPTVTLTALMQGVWNNAFGRTGWLVEDVALLIGMIVGNPELPTEFGGTGRLKIKEYLDLRVAFRTSADVKKIGFEGETKEDISLLNTINLVSEIINKPLPATTVPSLSINKNAIVKYATAPVEIGTKIITPGLKAKAEMDILNTRADLDISIGCDDPLSCGFKAYASLDPININNILKITGYEDKETNVKLDKPKLDIEFTVQRQIVHLSGLLNIAEIIQSKTFLEFSNQGIAFDFEEAFGGDTLTWIDAAGKKVPLLYARVKGKSSNILSNPDFTIAIVFQQYLNQYLAGAVKQKIETAKKEVEEGIERAQKEIDKIDAVIADMNKKIGSARQDVARAKSDYGKRIDEVRELQKKLDAASKDSATIDKKIHDLKMWYASLPESDVSKELTHFLNIDDLARYSLFNATPFTIEAQWEFIGALYQRTIAPQRWVSIKSGLLHKGWSTAYLKNVNVGQVWGKNPETGTDLVFTTKMINAKGECRGFEPSFYTSTGQAVDHKFTATIVPQKNPSDNYNWWPQIVISHDLRDIILASKGSKAGEYAAKLAALEAEKFVVQTTLKGIRDTLNIATGTQKGFEGIIDVGDTFLKDVVQPGGTTVLQGSALISKGILEGVKQTTLGIMDAGKEIITRPLELFDINEIYYNGSLDDLKDGILGDVKVVGMIASQPFTFAITIAPKKGIDDLINTLNSLANTITDEVKTKTFDPITKKLNLQYQILEQQAAKISPKK